METAKEKIAYLRGMIAGGEAIKDDTVSNVLRKVTEVLDELAEEVEQLYFEQDELADYVEAIDEDLSEVEHLFGEDDQEQLTELECPSCKEEVFFDEDFLYDDVEVSCPECGEIVFESSSSNSDLSVNDERINK